VASMEGQFMGHQFYFLLFFTVSYIFEAYIHSSWAIFEYETTIVTN
jgi:hypothetical protein